MYFLINPKKKKQNSASCAKNMQWSKNEREEINKAKLHFPLYSQGLHHGRSCSLALHLCSFPTPSEIHVNLLQIIPQRNNMKGLRRKPKKRLGKCYKDRKKEILRVCLIGKVSMENMYISLIKVKNHQNEKKKKRWRGKEKGMDLNNPDADHWFKSE